MSEKCGTYAGWNAHRRADEKPCDDCREAQRLYARERRARGGAPIERDTMMNRARSRAAWRLKGMYPVDFDMLVADEMRVELAAARSERATA